MNDRDYSTVVVMVVFPSWVIIAFLLSLVAPPDADYCFLYFYLSPILAFGVLVVIAIIQLMLNP